MRRWYLTLSAVVLGTLTFGCQPAPHSASTLIDHTRVLRATLAALNLSDPAADVELHLQRGDKRFRGIFGISCAAPGTADADQPLVQRFGVTCLEGTTDTIPDANYAPLEEKAARYASAYNAELLRRIRAGAVI